MPYWRLFYHLIWATTDRQPLIEAAMWPELERLFLLTSNKNQLVVHGIDGVANHVHLAVTIPPAISIATAVGRLKGSSSHLLNENFGTNFRWQAEYGVVSFGERHLQSVLSYINDQPCRHAQNRLWPTLETLLEPPQNRIELVDSASFTRLVD